MTVERIQFTSGLEIAHEQWQKAGLVDQAFGAVDERDSLPVRRWAGAKFEDLPNRTKGAGAKAATARVK